MFQEAKSSSQVGTTSSGLPKSNLYGKDAEKFSSTLKPTERDDPTTNNFQKANYGLLIYDKKRAAFRLEPIHRQIIFEKEKVVDRQLQQKSKVV